MFEKKYFSFKFITEKKLDDVIDKLPQNKASVPGFRPAWSFKRSKMSIETHLQFAINNCISNKVFPDVRKNICNSILQKEWFN